MDMFEQLRTAIDQLTALGDTLPPEVREVLGHKRCDQVSALFARPVPARDRAAELLDQLDALDKQWPGQVRALLGTDLCDRLLAALSGSPAPDSAAPASEVVTGEEAQALPPGSAIVDERDIELSGLAFARVRLEGPGGRDEPGHMPSAWSGPVPALARRYRVVYRPGAYRRTPPAEGLMGAGEPPPEAAPEAPEEHRRAAVSAFLGRMGAGTPPPVATLEESERLRIEALANVRGLEAALLREKNKVTAARLALDMEVPPARKRW